MRIVACVVFLSVAAGGFSVGFGQEPVFYYAFSGDASDASGNGHDGAVYGAVLTEDAWGASGQAYLFDGGDVISVADHPDFTLGSDDFTLAVRMNIHASSSFSYYVLGHDEGAGTTRKWILWITSSTIGLHVNSPSTGGFWITVHGWTPITNSWFHCAVRRSGDTFDVFVNGNSIGSNVNTRAFPDPATTFTMGDAEGDHQVRALRHQNGRDLHQEERSDLQVLPLRPCQQERL